MLEQIRREQELQARSVQAAKERNERATAESFAQYKETCIKGERNFASLKALLNTKGIKFSTSNFSSFEISCGHFAIQRIEPALDREGFTKDSCLALGCGHDLMYCRYPGNDKWYFVIADKTRISKIAIDYRSRDTDLRDKFILFMDHGKSFFEFPLFHMGERRWERGERGLLSYIRSFFSAIVEIEKR